MARTRAEISALVVLNTGRSDKTSLINSMCDSALKIAMTKHPFSDSLHICDDVVITEDAVSSSIAALEESSVAIGDVIDILTARIVDVDGTYNTFLPLKNKQWWDRNVINPEDNNRGRPQYGFKFGTNLIYDRPSDDGLALRLRVSAVPTFSGDSSECPIKILDTFVEQYATAMTYLSLGMDDKYVSWYIMCMGRNYDQGQVGGSLLAAIQQDKSDSGEEKFVERGVQKQNKGVSIQNLLTDSDRYGETHSWY